jgi:hypothetical protein
MLYYETDIMAAASSDLGEIIKWLNSDSMEYSFINILQHHYFSSFNKLMVAETEADKLIAASDLQSQSKEILHIMQIIECDRKYNICSIRYYYEKLLTPIPDYIAELFAKWPRYAIHEKLTKRRITTLKFIIDIDDIKMLSMMQIDFFKIKYERLYFLATSYQKAISTEEKTDLLTLIRHENNVVF